MRDPHELSISLKTAGGTWMQLGRDRYRGVWPEHFQATADPWGPATCSFDLHRDSGALHPDLAAFTPCTVEIAGMQCWSGRVKETPTRDGADSVISVQGEGWQYHLDDDVYERAYVHTRLSDWRDQRSFLTADLTTYLARYAVGSDGGITLLAPGGTGNLPLNSKVGITLDLKNADAKRIVISWDRIGAAFNATFIGIGHDAEAELGAAGAAGTGAELLFGTGLHVTAAGPTSVTLTTSRRYLTLYWFPFTGLVAAGDQGVRITAAKVFQATAYESAGASVLKADQVILDALTQATMLLDADRSGVQAGTFSIPEFALDGARTPREVWAAVNAYENYDTKIDANGRPVFRPRPSAPIFEIGEWSGADVEDVSANSGGEIYNRVFVQGIGPDGAQLTVIRTATPATTLVDRQGFRRTKILIVGTSIVTASGQRLGDLHLQAHATTPFRGNFTATGQGGVRKVLGGQTVHPAWLLRESGELVRCSHRIDPDTGGWGRTGRIAAVTYDHDSLTASIALDEDRAGFEALLSRLAIVNG